ATARATETISTTGGSATVTPSPVSPPLALSPAAQITLVRSHRTCTGSQTIKNQGSATVSWQWPPAVPNGGAYSLDRGRSCTTGTQNDGGLAAAATDVLTVSFACQSGQTYSVTMTDSNTNTYSFTLRLPG